ncbi:hypothetical protein BCR34DRAFT_573671 [Clohesyomyces aquaticus]|uniref:Uncharacterized protein n=1 Tax=Clohesyomyces aquaticus TaxID=1231657 RepID=A0A1Y1YYK4_9PLEO|nr:hypothetical protein BCR34DRAFT_573671 [Clohesyomyces aquaticus]
MLDHFELRHTPPLILASIWTIGGLMSLTHGPEAAMLAFGLNPRIASSKDAAPVIKCEGSRITTIGLAMWGIYLGGHLEALDILISCIGWMAVVDGVVLSKDGVPGKARQRLLYQSVIAIWGLLRMTSGKYF